MKIYSWNVNGIKSIFEKGFLNWLTNEQPEIVCLQEIKTDDYSLENKYKKVDGYNFYASYADKKGYSGVAVYTKIKPLKVEHNVGFNRFDNEGRFLKLSFEDFTIYNLYIPNGSKDKKNIPYKISVLDYLINELKNNKDEKIILLGDFNICHKEIDIANYKYNLEKTTFTKKERKKMDEIVEVGFVDTFRFKKGNEIKYSCWSYAANQRIMDIGYRYDYIFLNKKMINKLKDSFIDKKVLGSDHCPVGIEIDSKMKIDYIIHTKDTLF